MMTRYIPVLPDTVTMKDVTHYINDDLLPVITSIMTEIDAVNIRLDKAAGVGGDDEVLIRTILEDRVEELENSLIQLEKVNSENLKHIAVLQEENSQLRSGHGVSYHINTPPDSDE